VTSADFAQDKIMGLDSFFQGYGGLAGAATKN